MLSRRSQTVTTLAKALGKLVRRLPRTELARKRKARIRFLEQLEPRNLMALDIVGLSPADGAINWPLDSDLVITFNEPVSKGQGNIHVVRDIQDTLGVAVDVRSSAVSISGSTVTVDLPSDLSPGTAYYVLIDNGAFLDTSASSTPGATLLTQNFDLLPLGPFTTQSGGNATGTDYTLTPPLNFSVVNDLPAPVGVPEWTGWSFANKESWIRQADQYRSEFKLGSGTIAVGDTDEYDDLPVDVGTFNSLLITRPIQLTGVAPNSVVLEFDSSFRPENSQIGTLDVRFDGGAWQNLLTLNPLNTSNEDAEAPNIVANVNEHLVTGGNTGTSTSGTGVVVGNVPIRDVLNPPGATTMEFRWGVTGQNDWWWAIDNLKVTGQVTGVPFQGISDPTAWNLDVATLSLAISPTTILENGGVATGTVTRNGSAAAGDLASDLIVALSSDDVSEATVPATVTILAGQTSATFPITAVDDSLSDRLQTATIKANAPLFVEGKATLNVLDDEGPKVVTLDPADNSTGVNYLTNLTITYDTNVKKGNGLINIVRASDNFLASSFNVNDLKNGIPIVSISGPTVTINPPINLTGLTEYYVLIDDGAILEDSLTPTSNSILLTQNFDLLPLGPFTSETGGDGTDFTLTPPTGFSINNNGMSGSSPSNFEGWSFVAKDSWVDTPAGGDRNVFTNGVNNVAVADASRWYATTQNVAGFNSFLHTTPINLSDIAAGSVSLEFDFSFDQTLPTIGVVDVSYDGGTTWNPLFQFDNSDIPNDHILINSAGLQRGPAGSLIGTLVNPSAGVLQFRFGLKNAIAGWLAIDNLKVTGGVIGVPSQGISLPTAFSFTTAEAPILTVTINVPSMSENGGSAIGTVTRNLGTVGDLVVTLTSSDTTEAIVPATVIIPNGQASATFPITAVDDTIGENTQTVSITASFTDYFSVPATIQVLNDDFPKPATFSPADNSTAVPVASNLVVTFDQNVKKGNGFVHIVRAADNKVGLSIDIQSSAITVAGAVVTIDPPSNLAGSTDYYVLFDDGAIVNNTLSITDNAVLLSQDFELLPLGPAVFETFGDGTDFTLTPPTGYAVDNSLMPQGGVTEWNGWSFADKDFWDNNLQGRQNFARGSGTIAVGDTDEWDDRSTSPNNTFNSFFVTSPINLSTVLQNSVVLEFDSSFRPENSQIGTLEVSFNGGASWEPTPLLTLNPSNTVNTETATNISERRSISVANPESGNMMFRWGVTGANDFWWALDNIKVTGDVRGLASPGISDSTIWNFKTVEVQTLGLSIAPTPINENGGIATGTVTRNLGTTGDLVVNLTSSNPLQATVPATVTILAGQSSANFPITAVDNAVADGSKIVTVSATATAFFGASSSLTINDNEVPNVIISEIMYNPAGSEPRTEWFEIYNRGSTVADLSGWRFDDEDTTNWGAMPAGTLLQPGQIGVVYNSFFGSNTDELFRTEWDVPANALVIGTFWGILDNEPNASTGNEVIVLRDSGNAVIDLVSYDDNVPVWPANTNGTSIYLLNVLADNDLGANWSQTALGTDGGRNPTGPTYNAVDRGSPGVIPAASAVAPKISSTVFGDGTAQRSMVQTIKVNFDSIVSIGEGAFVLEQGGSGGFSPIAPADLSIAVNSTIVNGKTVAELTFSSASSFIQGGSLPDGNYRLTVLSNLITLGGLELDGDNNGTAGGNYVKGADEADAFFRRFGDSDGNRTATLAELGQLRAAINKPSPDPGYNARFDFNNNGVVSLAELGQLRQRINQRLNF